MTPQPISRADTGAHNGLAGNVAHYENFPVASWLCPAPLRSTVAAIYHFARTADDIADEGNAPAADRLSLLARYRVGLDLAAGDGDLTATGWPQVFNPLRSALQKHRLPLALLHDLISAFEQDVRHTHSGHRYGSLDELMGYCRLSANPVGRLLLHLYGVGDGPALERSDQICSALQLINFWQDLSVDLPRQRHYLPSDLLIHHGLTHDDFGATSTHPHPQAELAQRAVVAALCQHARALMMQGAPLVQRLPGRAGWELRLVVQGGIRILDHMARLDHRSWLRRPTVGRVDLPVLVWRSLWM